jgi:L-2,4-diaminobutyrate decarboxylase
MSSVPPSIADAYDPEKFREQGHRLIDAIADALARWHRREGVVLPWRAPDEAVRSVARQQLGGADPVDHLRRVMAGSTAMAHPHCMGHQVPPPLPAAVLAEMVTSLLNNGTSVYEYGPVSAPTEIAVVEWMARKLGMDDDAGGVMTSGGSLGNLTALLAMRQAQAGFDVWKQGAHAGPPLAVIASSEAHYSVSRTMRIMGWGDGGVIVAPVDRRHRMTAAAVEGALQFAGNRRVIGIVAAAGSTATGAFDPLEELAEVAQRHRLWLHVDAAHGGSVALSRGHRGKLAGIEHADSVVWDAHKLMMMSALATAVIFKKKWHAYGAFAEQEASYLFSGAAQDAWWDLGTRTLECTKRMMSIEVWTALRVHGEDLFGELVDRVVVLAAELASRVDRAEDFELAVFPELNIVCYRHRPPGMQPGAALDAHNRGLRKACAEDGRFYIAGTQLTEGYFLRSAIMNPLIEPGDFDDLLDHLRLLCRS